LNGERRMCPNSADGEQRLTARFFESSRPDLDEVTLHVSHAEWLST
jgi:hypothetical protein